MMRVDNKLDRLTRGHPDFRQHHLHAAGEIPIHHLLVIIEDNPTLVAVAFVYIPLVKVDSRCNFLHLAHWVSTCERERPDHCEKKGSSFHVPKRKPNLSAVKCYLRLSFATLPFSFGPAIAKKTVDRIQVCPGTSLDDIRAGTAANE